MTMMIMHDDDHDDDDDDDDDDDHEDDDHAIVLYKDVAQIWGGLKPGDGGWSHPHPYCC